MLHDRLAQFQRVGHLDHLAPFFQKVQGLPRIAAERAVLPVQPARDLHKPRVPLPQDLGQVRIVDLAPLPELPQGGEQVPRLDSLHLFRVPEEMQLDLCAAFLQLLHHVEQPLRLPRAQKARLVHADHHLGPRLRWNENPLTPYHYHWWLPVLPL